METHRILNCQCAACKIREAQEATAHVFTEEDLQDIELWAKSVMIADLAKSPTPHPAIHKQTTSKTKTVTEVDK